jgi:hypothetical protein
MTVECPWCYLRRNTGELRLGEVTPWRATGQLGRSRRGRRRAELVCEGCGRRFWSGIPEAVQAGEAVVAADERAGLF